MAVSAKVELTESNLLFQQGTVCATELANSERTTLNNVNPQNAGGGATLVVTNLKTNAATQHRSPRPRGALPSPISVAADASLRYEFFLPDRVTFPEPGQYEIRASYEWEGGEIQSEPTRITLRESHPRTAFIASAFGGEASAYFAAWVNHAGPKDDEFELWLSEISTNRKPRIGGFTRLVKLKSPVQPVVSVPPGSPPAGQWLAWIEEDTMSFLVRTPGGVSGVETHSLKKRKNCHIIGPLLQLPRRPGAAPGADVLLYEFNPGDSDWTVFVARIDEKNNVTESEPVKINGNPPLWAQTAYLSSGRRMTFLAVMENGDLAIKRINWSVRDMPGQPETIQVFEAATCLSGDLWWSRDEKISGAVFGEVEGAGSGKYAIFSWSLDKRLSVTMAEPASVIVGESGPLGFSTVGVSAMGEPHVLMATSGDTPKWFFCSRGGTALPLSTLGDVRLPARILFRRGTDPTIQYCRNGHGFQFAKPE